MNLLNKIGGIFGLIFGGIIVLPAQNLLSTLVQLEVPATETFIPISPAELWLPSLQLKFAHSGNSVPHNWYSVDTVGIHLICADSILLQDLFLTLQYRKLPSQITSQIVSIVGQEDLPEPQREYLLKPALPQTYLPAREEKSLIYSGNFVRGIGLGNRQSLGFESAFNLQMSGQLAPDLNILASISDQSVPLQPDGSTQSLRDLDQIFIQLQKDSTVLTMGDFDQSSPTGYFMRYQKRSLGIQLEYQEKLDPSKSLAGKVGFAMNRGQFNRYTIPNKEGNQGPYPLPGAKGEQLVVLIANTEKIYLDGILLLRGYDQDYIIDYNLGVITFTNRRMITQDSRIIAEYEYTDLAYPRTLFTAENQIKINRWTIQSNFYREQDSKKSGFGQKLSDEDREILANAGDNIVGQFGSGIDLQADYQEDQIRYKLIDTLVQGTMYHEVLVRSSESEIARYTAKFTNVGAGNGNYLRSNPESNGAVYQWIAPDPLSGKSNGQFEPIVSLVAPQAQQMVTFGGKYEGKKGQIIETEMAISSFDKNRFSKIGDQDNTGLAVLTKFLQPIKYNSQSKTKTAINGQYEYRNSFFAEINPYRAAEFARDWNLRSVQQQEEHIATIGFQMAQSERKKISYQAQTLLRPGDYQCLKHNLSADFLQNGWEFHTRSSYLNARDSSMATSFARPNISLAKTFSKLKKIKIGLDVEMENQSSKDLQNNELQIGSFQNQSYRASAGLPLKKGNLLQMSISQRLNKLPEKGQLTDATKSLDFGLNGSLSPSRYTTLSWNATFRKLTLINENLQGIRNTNSILGRLQYDLKRWHEAVISSTIYEMNSGQEAKTTFLYKRTLQPGTGEYSWQDLNGDSIQQVNEFFIAPFQDQADFIRFAVLSDEYVQTNNLRFNQLLQLEPGRIWKSGKGLMPFIGKFSSLSTWNIERKSHQREWISAWNPFKFETIDTSLVSAQSAFQSHIFFNRNHPIFESSFGINTYFNQYLLLSGSEQSRQKIWTYAGKYRLADSWTLACQYLWGEKQNASQSFAQNAYYYRFWQLEPELLWQKGSEIQIRSRLKWRRMMAEQAEYQIPAMIIQPGLDIQWAIKQKTRLRARLSYAEAKFDRLDMPVLTLALLEGLSPGENWLWGLSLEQKLSDALFLSISYDGRKSELGQPIHIGKAQISAQF